MATLGIITCEILELEFASLLSKDSEVAGITVIDNGFCTGFMQAYELIKRVKPTLINCAEQYIPVLPGRLEVLVQVLEVGLHMVIQNLRTSVINAAVKMGPQVNAIVLGYGLCGNALKDHEEISREAGCPVFIPLDDDRPVDDCVGLLIGGQKNYYEELCKVAGTFFMNAGFSRHWQNLTQRTYGISFDAPIVKRIMASYKRSLLLATPVLSQEEMAANIKQFNDAYELQTDVRPGTLKILEQTLATGKSFVMSNTSLR